MRFEVDLHNIYLAQMQFTISKCNLRSVTLQIFAESIREERSFGAQEAAEKMSVKMLFPMILFIFPAVLIVLVGPAIISLGEALS